MSTITLAELERTAPTLSEAIKEREEIVITSGDTVVARLIIEAPTSPPLPRPFGHYKGQFTVPADFNDPIPELEDAFYND